MKFLFDLRNDLVTRENSFDSELIPWAKHVSWFEKSICMATREIYILYEGNIPIGQLRIDTEDSIYKISYGIANEYRGMGYGKRLLLLAEHMMVEKEFKGTFVGDVKKDNIASQKVFIACGYLESDLNDGIYRYKKDIGLQP